MKRLILPLMGLVSACAMGEEQQKQLDLTASDAALMTCEELDFAMSEIKVGMRELGVTYGEAANAENEFQRIGYDYADQARFATTQSDAQFAEIGGYLAVAGLLTSSVSKIQSEADAQKLKTSA